MEQVDGSGITVLHIDDNGDFLTLAADALHRADSRFEIRTAPGGAVGLERLGPDIDCVVCDYRMPDLDGLEVLATIREADPNLPFILFTGEGSEDVAAEAIEKGVTSYLQKETGVVQFSVLANRIRNHVEQYRASERAARLEEEREIVSDVATDMFFVVDLTSGAMRVSDGIGQFGYDPGTIDPDIEWWIERIHPEDRVWMDAQHEAAMRPDETGFDEFTGDQGRFESEYRWQRANGTYASVVGRGATLFEDGHAVKQIGTMRDITDRKRRERDLDLFETLVDHSNDEVYVVDADSGEILHVNQTVCDHLDVAPEELVGEPVTTVSAGFADLDEWDVHIDELREVDGLRREVTHVRADGTTYPAEVSVSYVDQDTGGYVITTARDITERKRRDRELRQRESHLEQSQEIADLGSWRLDLQADDLEWSDEVYRIFGVNAAESLTFERFLDQVHPADRDDVEEQWAAALEGDDYDIEHRLQVDGETRWVRETAELSFDANGHPQEGIGVVQDITERKQRERELGRKNERLEEFASIVSHDLRNPLTVAEGRLDVVRAECDSPHLDAVATAHERMEALIEDTLTLARQGGRIDETEPVTLPEVVETCWQTVETADVTLVVDTDRTIQADPDRLTRLLENLFRNAVEHAGPAVTVRAGETDHGFYIADDGPGIPDDERATVFEAGYSTADEGTGFGLRIVEQIADAHGWSVTVSDSLDGGTRVTVGDVETARSDGSERPPDPPVGAPDS